MLSPGDAARLPPSAHHLFLGSLAPGTWQSYATKFRLFAAFCASLPDSPPSLPASSTTVARYISHLFDKGTIAAVSLHQYLWPIARAHEDLGLPSPFDRVVASLRTGFQKLRAVAPAAAGRRSLQRVPLPAPALLAVFSPRCARPARVRLGARARVRRCGFLRSLVRSRRYFRAHTGR